MYNGIRKIEEVIDFIEKNITSEIDYEELAAKMTLSVYEFRRIFAFVVGCPLSEYVRKRKLSLAACELIANPQASIREIGEKYGYSTLAAFSKAFSEYHGFSPTACRKDAPEISIFPTPKFEWQKRATEKLAFRIVSDSAFAIRGYGACSDYTDTCCCEGVWNDFYNSGADGNLSADTLFVSYRNGQGSVRCHIGERIPIASMGERDEKIPECEWLSVKMNTTDDEAVNQKYNTVIYDILPSARLKRKNDVPTVEIFPRDMLGDDFLWEIRIPVEKE